MSFRDLSDAAKMWVVIFIAGLVIGLCILGWYVWLGPLFNQASYQQFNDSPQHLNAVAQKFSDDCLQLAEATDTTTRKAIENDIYTVAATVDLKLVQMPDATRSCVNHAIADVTR